MIIKGNIKLPNTPISVEQINGGTAEIVGITKNGILTVRFVGYSKLLKCTLMQFFLGNVVKSGGYKIDDKIKTVEGIVYEFVDYKESRDTCIVRLDTDLWITKVSAIVNGECPVLRMSEKDIKERRMDKRDEKIRELREAIKTDKDYIEKINDRNVYIEVCDIVLSNLHGVSL